MEVISSINCHEFFKLQSLDIFRLMDCEKMNDKYTFLLYFFMIYSKIDLIFWRNGYWKYYELLKLFISYVFVKKTYFFLFFNVIYFDSLKGFSLNVVNTRRRNIYFIRNKFIHYAWLA